MKGRTFCYLQLQRREGCQPGPYRKMHPKKGWQVGDVGTANVWQKGWSQVGFVGSCKLANLKRFQDIGLSLAVYTWLQGDWNWWAHAGSGQWLNISLYCHSSSNCSASGSSKSLEVESLLGSDVNKSSLVFLLLQLPICLYFYPIFT